MRTSLRTAGWIIFAALPVLVSSCSFFRQPANAEATRDDVTEMRREQTEMMALLLELRQRIDTQDQAVSGLKADTNLALRELTDKLESLMARTEDQPVRRPTPPVVPAPVPSGGDSTVNAGDVQASYDAAKRDFSRGNYSMAIVGFDAVLSQDPRGNLADDAQYWKGEAYYSLGQLDRAIQELLKVRDLYADSKMICAATYKVGLAFL